MDLMSKLTILHKNFWNSHPLKMKKTQGMTKKRAKMTSNRDGPAKKSC
jgi:hypothetical protein